MRDRLKLVAVENRDFVGIRYVHKDARPVLFELKGFWMSWQRDAGHGASPRGIDDADGVAVADVGAACHRIEPHVVRVVEPVNAPDRRTSLAHVRAHGSV